MRAPRTLRTALVAAGVTAALGVSAAGAFAQPAPEARTVASASHANGHCQKTNRVYVKTVKLADRVSKAKVFKTGKHRYEAEIWAKGLKYGTMTAKHRTAHANHNGLHIALHPNGKVTSWVERAKPKPVVKRVLVSTAPLADGSSTAKLYRISANHYEADIYAHGTKLDTLVANGRAAYGENNGLHVTLQPDGRLSSWVDDTPAPDPTPQPDETDTPAPLAPATPDTPATTAPSGSDTPTTTT
ncbi:hypothetical protein ACFY1L_27910 [Streptomyces sp. NPDC001663]|uniref:hypothetical protein n=1 Tax=Streptomyces sp. NPDC001663 TaxID=3364597 RepID=UPI00369D734F